ncbi:MAG: glycosyltransferase family 4 protein [Desulfobacteraceae bacterium]
MNNKTILQLQDFAPPYGGSFIASLTALGKALQCCGCRQVLVFPEAAKHCSWLKQLYEQDIPIHLISMTSPFQLARTVEKIIERENAQILHSHFTAFDFPAWMAMQLRKLKGSNCSVIWHMRCPFPVEFSVRRWLRDTIKHRIIGKEVYCVAISQGSLQTMCERGLGDKRTHVIPNNIDENRLTRSTMTREEVRQEFSVAGDDTVLLLFGMHPIRKGADVVLQGLKDLITRGYKIKLLVVGTQALEEYLYNLYGLHPPSWLTILPPTEYIADYFQAADIFVSASRAEGFSNAVAEAMYFGLPVVSSDIPGLDWAHEAPGVEFFPSEDSAGLANAIIKVLQWSPEQHKILTTANRALVMEKYSMEIWVKRVFELYKNILAA